MDAKILIVDDAPANLIALEAVLRPLNREIVCADSGEAALRHLLTEEFAVVLLDVRMSGFDGFDTAAMIRGRTRTEHVPIIFLTAFGDNFEHAHRAYDLGAFDFITKPFDAAVLRTKVGGFVKLFEQTAELAQAREATRLRDVCIAVLGHDLRNPLNAVQMAATMLTRANDLTEKQRAMVAHINAASARMERLIDNVLDFARGELGGGMSLRIDDANLAKIARQIVDETMAAHPGRTIELIAAGDTDGKWDAARIGQLLSNLVGNAVQHCTDGPIVVEVEANSSHGTIAVTNRGVIPPDARPRLFEPFRRGDGDTPGLGLGLYIVRGIVDAHGGVIDLRCDDAANQTTFVAKLPRQPASAL